MASHDAREMNVRRRLRAPSKSPDVAGLETLSLPERLLLFCVASGTDPQRAGISLGTSAIVINKNLMRRNETGLVLTQLGRATLDALLRGPGA
jgi:hypothetical protein